MKRNYWLVLLLLFIAAAVFLPPASWADGAPPDPTVKFSSGGGSPETTAGGTATDPLYVVDGSVSDFILEDPGDGVEYVEVIPQAGESQSYFSSEGFTCEAVPPAATGCAFITPQGLYSNIPAGLLNNASDCESFSGDGISCPAVEVEFFGTFYVGEDIQISVAEPSTIVLLCAGLALLVGLSLRKNSRVLLATR